MEKDEILQFCIDLRRLNAYTVNYSLTWINETLNCLNGAVWFTSLALKLWYWQLEMEEDCKALTTFTVEPLGLNECDRLPLGLTNTHAT